MKLLSCFILIISIPLHGQVIVEFEKDTLDRWTQFPEGRWEISPESSLAGEQSLHHRFDNASTGTDYIGMNLEYPDLEDTLRFSFLVRHGYNPSASNNWQMFLLASDIKNLEPGSTDASCLMFGVNFNSSDDIIKLQQLRDGEMVDVIISELNYQESIGPDGIAAFQLERYPEGRWSIYYSDWDITSGAYEQYGEEVQWNLLGTGLEFPMLHGKYLGFRYEYSSSQDRKLWLDNLYVYGTFFPDTVPPAVVEAESRGYHQLELVLSEPVALGEREQYTIAGAFADSVFWNGNRISLWFDVPFKNREFQQVRIRDLSDQEGNVLKDTTCRFFPDNPEFGDVIISEVMVDPTPAVYLPECEYIELYNRHLDPIQLGSFLLMVNEKGWSMPEAVILPGEYRLLVSEDCLQLRDDPRAVKVFTSSTFLPNSGAVLKLLDPNDRLIHIVEYESLDDYDPIKSGGGWSLERIDLDNICGDYENWTTSVSWKGGTPGYENSVSDQIIDQEAPVLEAIGLPSLESMSLRFNEIILPVGPASSQVSIQNHSLVSAIDHFPSRSISFANSYAPAAGREIEIILDPPLSADSTYVLKITSFADCTGNQLEDQELIFRVPVSPSKTEVLINEIMYDPLEGEPEYIELYNNSKHYFDLRDIAFSVVEPGTYGYNHYPVSESSILFGPGEYRVVCKDIRLFEEVWTTGNVVNVTYMENWKVLPNDGTCIHIFNRSGEPLDQLCYHDSLHSDYAFLTAGIALERISHELCNPWYQCWTSAASSAGHGTPGAKNSQSISESAPAQFLTLVPEVFSPDLDGFQDQLEIHLTADISPGRLYILITTLEGLRVRHLVQQAIASENDVFIWNGEDDFGKLVPSGIYIVHAAYESGSVKGIARKACALHYR